MKKWKKIFACKNNLINGIPGVWPGIPGSYEIIQR
jgi:hypothetical protein